MYNRDSQWRGSNDSSGQYNYSDYPERSAGPSGHRSTMATSSSADTPPSHRSFPGSGNNSQMPRAYSGNHNYQNPPSNNSLDRSFDKQSRAASTTFPGSSADVNHRNTSFQQGRGQQFDNQRRDNFQQDQPYTQRSQSEQLEGFNQTREHRAAQNSMPSSAGQPENTFLNNRFGSTTQPGYQGSRSEQSQPDYGRPSSHQDTTYGARAEISDFRSGMENASNFQRQNMQPISEQIHRQQFPPTNHYNDSNSRQGYTDGQFDYSQNQHPNSRRQQMPQPGNYGDGKPPPMHDTEQRRSGPASTQSMRDHGHPRGDLDERKDSDLRGSVNSGVGRPASASKSAPLLPTPGTKPTVIPLLDLSLDSGKRDSFLKDNPRSSSSRPNVNIPPPNRDRNDERAPVSQLGDIRRGSNMPSNGPGPAYHPDPRSFQPRSGSPVPMQLSKNMPLQPNDHHSRVPQRDTSFNPIPPQRGLDGGFSRSRDQSEFLIQSDVRGQVSQPGLTDPPRLMQHNDPGGFQQSASGPRDPLLHQNMPQISMQQTNDPSGWSQQPNNSRVMPQRDNQVDFINQPNNLFHQGPQNALQGPLPLRDGPFDEFSRLNEPQVMGSNAPPDTNIGPVPVVPISDPCAYFANLPPNIQFKQLRGLFATHNIIAVDISVS